MHRMYNSIRVRITITLFLVVFAGLVSFEYFEYEKERSQAITQQQDLAAKKSHRLKESLILPLWELDKSWVKRVIDNEITDQSVYAIIVNSEGSFFEGVKRDESWQPVRSGNNITGDYITVTQQIRHEGEVIGSVKIYLTMRFILKALQEKGIFELLMALLLGVVGLTLLLLMLNRMVITPIEQMLKSTLAIADGDYSHVVNAQQADEIGQLARSINVMKESIQTREEERDGALNRLGESESRFRQLAMQISVPLVSVSSDGKMEFFNDRFVQTFGYTLKDVPTIEAWWPLAYPDEKYRAWVQQTWDRACQLAVAENRDIERVEYSVTCKSGDVRSVEISGVFLGDDMLVTLLDLTERKRAEAKMRRYAQALEQSGEAIVITDVDGAIEHINAAYSEITGYSAKEAVGKNPRMLKSGSQNARFYEKMWHTLLKGEVWQGKVINRKKSGDHYPAMLTISPIRDDAGKIVNYIGVQQNLEKFEELEAQFHQSQKMEAIGTLVGGIAHDFNNNLAGITGNGYTFPGGVRVRAAGISGRYSRHAESDQAGKVEDHFSDGCHRYPIFPRRVRTLFRNEHTGHGPRYYCRHPGRPRRRHSRLGLETAGHDLGWQCWIVSALDCRAADSDYRRGLFPQGAAASEGWLIWMCFILPGSGNGSAFRAKRLKPPPRP